MAIELTALIDRLVEIRKLFPEQSVPVFVQMDNEYSDLVSIEHEFHDDWTDRYPDGRHTVTLSNKPK